MINYRLGNYRCSLTSRGINPVLLLVDVIWFDPSIFLDEFIQILLLNKFLNISLMLDAFVSYTVDVFIVLTEQLRVERVLIERELYRR